MIDQLRAELARTDLPEETRRKLQNVQTVLDRDPQARLESFTMAGGEPRAVVAFGDPTRADLVAYLLHGTDSDLDDFPGWADAAQRLCMDVIRTCVGRGTPREVAAIAWFGWDAGTHTSALATRHATIGAAQLAVDIDKLAARNPQAHIAVLTYSYSSTLLGELFAMNLTDAVRTAFSLASAGVTHAASVAISAAITAADVVVYATEGANDSIAPLGRLGQHPVDVRDIAGVIGFDCDGGEAPSVDGGTVVGIPVEGHASQSSTDEHGVRHVGYYDERAQGYLTMASLLADAATGGR